MDGLLADLVMFGVVYGVIWLWYGDIDLVYWCLLVDLVFLIDLVMFRVV